MTTDPIVTVLAEHRPSLWSDGKVSCHGCRDRDDEDWAEHYEDRTPDERRAVYADHRERQRPGSWEDHEAHVAEKIREALQAEALCWCGACDPGLPGFGIHFASRLSTCPDCGSKRCSRAAHHDCPCDEVARAAPASAYGTYQAPECRHERVISDATLSDPIRQVCADCGHVINQNADA